MSHKKRLAMYAALLDVTALLELENNYMEQAGCADDNNLYLWFARCGRVMVWLPQLASSLVPPTPWQQSQELSGVTLPSW